MSQPVPVRKAMTSNHTARAALRTFFAICAEWGLSSSDQMTVLGVSRSTYYKWKNDGSGSLSADTLERISYIFGIYKALQILLPNPAASAAWVRKPNSAPLFSGKSALDRMLSGQVADLYQVRRYLDGERGGWG